ncbi:MAG: hypothetical protein A3J35_01335 [Gammaproteobacteria bacterium RIFCSPLOWO2_02_FULL_52_10]|nr:MAG: hypothetical protein A3J35_01335 [Gammaproteobacteria bacterium RIFCSPLOWO2_02_FULL_52_10]OGT83262.1 MAG: hypothetical protein A3G96_03490 [Gammaproteobacteria bacterium RIFCSPLOWO2_12_FULL_52_10]
MCKSLNTILWLLLLGSFNVAASPGQLPQPFSASYSLHSMGTRIATMKRSFASLESGIYLYYSETNTDGLLALLRKDQIIEKSTWQFTEGQLQPLLYSYLHTGGKKNRNVEINFDWSARKITNSINGSSWQMPIQAYIMDKLLYQLAIMYDLDKGMNKISYAIADGGKIKTYDFELVGKEVVNTPIGDFDALKLVRHKSNTNQKTAIWCAKELGYLPVKVENVEDNGRQTTAIIETLTGSPVSNQ